MENLFTATTLVAALIAFIATLMQSLTGFGLAIIATPLFLIVYEPKDIVLILQITCIVVNVSFAYLLRKDIDKRFFYILSAGALVGQPLGYLVYTYAPSGLLKILVSIIILAFLIIMHCYKQAIRETTGKSAFVGFLSGILNTSTSISGPPLILYLASAKRDKVSMRATCIAYFAFANITALLGFLLIGQDLTFALEQSVILLPAALLGLWVGNRLFPYMSQKMFEKIIFVMLLFSSLYTIYTTL